jgi:site-specific DNA-methyltransferase (adenine-specific)
MNIVYNTDCLPAMKEYPDKYFDLAVVDPPYFSGPERRSYYGSNVSTTKVARHYYPVTEHWEVPGREYFDELCRISKNYIVFGCNYFEYGFVPGRIVWDKCNGSSTFSDCEIAATDCHDSVRLFRYMWNGMLQGKSINEGHIARWDKSTNEKRIHATQKPTDLYRWIFKRYSEPGFKILDTHVGSGTSRRAAYDFGLDFIGYEISPEYFELQEKAFEEYTAQLRITEI